MHASRKCDLPAELSWIHKVGYDERSVNQSLQADFDLLETSNLRLGRSGRMKSMVWNDFRT